MNNIDLSNAPEIHDGWIYSMVVLGFIGSFISFIVILIGAYNTYLVTKNSKLSKMLDITLTLYFIIWSCNFLACIAWCCLRTNLFHHLTKQKCVAIYILNYLFYMIAKYCLHILLLFRLYVAFKGTCLQINKKCIKTFIGIITFNFIILTFVWLQICINNVTIGISSIQSETLQICTLYNEYSKQHLSVYEHHLFFIWPTLYGGQDFLVGLITLILFIKKANELSKNMQIHDFETESLIRKLSILGAMAICSTFIFYTFAIPFYPNLTFLLPFDATLNSLCIILLLDYANKWYNKLCCCFDRALTKILHHIDVNELTLSHVVTSSINIDLGHDNKKEIKKIKRNDVKNQSLTQLRHNREPLPLAKSKYSRSAFL